MRRPINSFAEAEQHVRVHIESTTVHAVVRTKALWVYGTHRTVLTKLDDGSFRLTAVGPRGGIYAILGLEEWQADDLRRALL